MTLVVFGVMDDVWEFAVLAFLAGALAGVVVWSVFWLVADAVA